MPIAGSWSGVNAIGPIHSADGGRPRSSGK